MARVLACRRPPKAIIIPYSMLRSRMATCFHARLTSTYTKPFQNLWSHIQTLSNTIINAEITNVYDLTSYFGVDYCKRILIPNSLYNLCTPLFMSLCNFYRNRHFDFMWVNKISKIHITNSIINARKLEH